MPQAEHTSSPPPAADVLARRRRALPSPRRLLAGMRIRKKLIFLHTCFSLVLAGILIVSLWPAIMTVVETAERHEARLALGLAVARVRGLEARPGAAALAALDAELPEGVELARVPRAEAATLLLVDPSGPRSADDQTAAPAAASTSISTKRPAPPGGLAPALRDARLTSGRIAAVADDPSDPRSVIVSTAYLREARHGVDRLIVLMLVSLLGVYGLIALALEVLVLPAHVYDPIRRMLDADHAVQAGDREEELIREQHMPADELGEIMRSRNQTVLALRRHERELAGALARLEEAAHDLRRKNHLLETARQNLADADRLASLGMMSAGLAHELNTPLAVIKGLVEKQQSRPDRRLDEPEAALLLRVVGRLERLSESLLDFARVRAPRLTRLALAPLVDEAWTLVRLDRGARRVELVNAVDPALALDADPDRLVQVLVNVVRNAVDALDGLRPQTGAAAGPHPASALPVATVRVQATRAAREGRDWIALTITDDGPGIDPAVLARLFEPFVSTRLDSRGTGLGLAVSEGIIREHGGMILARNREDARGSVFEILLPQFADAGPPAAALANPPLASAASTAPAAPVDTLPA